MDSTRGFVDRGYVGYYCSCSLPELITLTKFEEWKERFGMELGHEKWYDKGKEISGVSADNPVMIVGTVVFEFSHGGRSLDLEFGVLKGGDTGSADVIVGNCVLRSGRYDGAVGVGAGVMARCVRLTAGG